MAAAYPAPSPRGRPEQAAAMVPTGATPLPTERECSTARGPESRACVSPQAGPPED